MVYKQTTYTPGYTYNLSGALVEEEYPSGRKVKNELDQNGDLRRIFGNASSTATERTYATSFAYTPDGTIEQIKLGNGLWETAKMNSRLQVTELSLGNGPTSGSHWRLNLDYGQLQTNGTVDATRNAGGIAKQTLTFTGLTNPFIQTFQYDSLNRLVEAKESNNSNQIWKQIFGYDRYGNRTTNRKWLGTTEQTLTADEHPEISDETNRIESGEGFTFDANGNIVIDALGRQFTYNGDNKQTNVKNSSNADLGTYSYDGEGKRVKKVAGSVTTIFVYSGSKLIAEYSTETPPSSPTINYTTADMLGSPRVITDTMGAVASRRDFMPFGEELGSGVGSRSSAEKYSSSGADGVRKRFTGYEKDNETNLDFAEARYYDNRFGRFTAVDPLMASATASDPQTFNRYAYVANNPVNLVDPSGMISESTGACGSRCRNSDGGSMGLISSQTGTSQANVETFEFFEVGELAGVPAITATTAVTNGQGATSQPIESDSSKNSESVSVSSQSGPMEQLREQQAGERIKAIRTLLTLVNVIYGKDAYYDGKMITVPVKGMVAGIQGAVRALFQEVYGGNSSVSSNVLVSRFSVLVASFGGSAKSYRATEVQGNRSNSAHFSKKELQRWSSAFGNAIVTRALQLGIVHREQVIFLRNQMIQRGVTTAQS